MFDFAAFVPLIANVGVAAPLGLFVTDHVYVRFASPASSAPSTFKYVNVVSTGDGEAEAADAIVGAALLTTRLEDPETLPLVALTVKLPTDAGAVTSPPLPIVPPVVDHTIETESGFPN